MRNYEKILIATITAGPLLVALIGAPLLRADTGDLNRQPLPFPAVSTGGLLDPETYAAIGDWLGDQIPFRRNVRNIDTKIDRGVFHDVGDGMILEGRDGWLFFEPALGLGLMPDFDPGNVRAAILRLKTEVEAAGKTFLFAFGPHKPTIYPQYLSDRDQRRQVEVRKRLESFRALMRDEPVGGFIDAWDALEAAAKTAPEPLYYPRDTHWTPLGAVELTRRIVETLEPGLTASLSVEQLKPRKYIPDLVKYAGLEQPETIHAWDFERPRVKWSPAGVESEGRTRTEQYTATAGRKSPLLPKIAVICDSYGTSMQPSMRMFFDSATFIHLQSGDTALARQALAEADIVLFVRVERFLWPMNESSPFAEDSEEVIRLLSSLRQHVNAAPHAGLTAGSVTGSGNAPNNPGEIAHSQPMAPMPFVREAFVDSNQSR